jgi:hypothetical protein
VPAPVDRGRRIEPSVLEGFQRGVTTRAEAIQLLGEPTTRVSGPEPGGTTLTWDYLHVDAQGSIAITTVLKFGPDDKLWLKLVNQSRQILIGDSGKPAN